MKRPRPPDIVMQILSVYACEPSWGSHADGSCVPVKVGGMNNPVVPLPVLVQVQPLPHSWPPRAVRSVRRDNLAVGPFFPFSRNCHSVHASSKCQGTEFRLLSVKITLSPTPDLALEEMKWGEQCPVRMSTRHRAQQGHSADLPGAWNSRKSLSGVNILKMQVKRLGGAFIKLLLLSPISI